MKKIFAMLIVLVMLGGCTMYSVEKVALDGTSTIITVKSTRSFDQPDLSYTRTGKDATFDFKAAGADNNTDAIVGMFAPLIQGILTGRIVLAQPMPPQ